MHDDAMHFTYKYCNLWATYMKKFCWRVNIRDPARNIQAKYLKVQPEMRWKKIFCGNIKNKSKLISIQSGYFERKINLLTLRLHIEWQFNWFMSHITWNIVYRVKRITTKWNITNNVECSCWYTALNDTLLLYRSKIFITSHCIIFSNIKHSIEIESFSIDLKKL